jgi:hypothetical protein
MSHLSPMFANLSHVLDRCLVRPWWESRPILSMLTGGLPYPLSLAPMGLALLCYGATPSPSKQSRCRCEMPRAAAAAAVSGNVLISILMLSLLLLHRLQPLCCHLLQPLCRRQACAE